MENGQEQDSTIESRNRRLNALERLAQGGSMPTTELPSSTKDMAAKKQASGSWRRMVWFGIVGVCLVAIVGAALIALRTHAQTSANASSRPIPSTVTVSLTAMGYFCPTDATWSPSGTMVALVVANGDATGCDNSPHGILVLDARGSQVLFQPLGQDSASPDNFLTWTLDSSSIVDMVYRVDPSIGGLTPVVRAFSVTAHGQSLTIVGNVREVSPDNPIDFSVWDMRQRAIAHTYQDGLPITQRYGWQTGGSIAPQPSGGPTGFAGSPTIQANAATFTFWQSGFIAPLVADTTNTLQAESYQSLAAAWSPDGRYLAIAAPLRALLPFDTAKHQSLSGSSLCAFALSAACAAGPLAEPDAAFAAVRAAVDAGVAGGPPQWDSAPVAWRPDGTLLATILPNAGFMSQQPKLVVTLLSTQTGQTRATLTVNRSATTDAGQGEITPILAWSPDGKRLSLLDYDSATITVWNKLSA